ncbi:MAG: amidohydrolase/deacetylase family metallohydrolase [Clostridiales bacterium]|jgi:dihydroorotase|nr:amidohydrolase/deacetylase family metallohydrolase [Clostridiales bacterium]
MAEQQKKYDLLIANGQVIDPANGLNARLDVAVNEGVIVTVARGIPKEDAKIVIDVKGSYVTPGLIDIHTHVYPLLPSPSRLYAIEPDSHMLRSGVTTAVDVGTAGWRDFLDFKESIIDTSQVRVLAMLNVAAGGMVRMISEQTPSDMHPEITAAVAKQYPDIIVGVKAAHYWAGKPFDDIHVPWASVDSGLKAAGLADLPFMIDFCPNYESPGRSYEELVLEKLRPGDIHTHVFAKQFPIVDDNGKVLPHMRKARERGVYFDVGHGAGSFWFRNGKRALDDGFAPDTLSTDMHYASVKPAGLDQLLLMSKFMNMGMSLEDVIKRSTSEPAKLIRRPDLGTLSVGACADIAVLRALSGDFGYVDCGGARLQGDSRLDCQLTIREGNVAYDTNGLSMPDWREAPEEYWKMPFLPGPGQKA